MGVMGGSFTRSLKGLELDPDQADVFGDVQEWFRRGRDQLYYLGGVAGSGKSTIAHLLAKQTARSVCYGAFTGKAALVMRRAGCQGAATLHSLIYTPKWRRDGTIVFYINAFNSPIIDADLVVADEVSMVDEKLGQDLLSLGRPVLVLGDPAQLPPPSGAGFLTGREPDRMLTKIHRQVAGNPIIELSRRIREGYDLEPCDLQGAGGRDRVIANGVLSVEDVRAFDAVIVGRNATRRSFNKRIRTSLGRQGPVPIVGDRIMCLRNDHASGFLNGEIFRVTGTPIARRRNCVRLEVESEDAAAGGKRASAMEVRVEFFVGGADALDAKTLGKTHHADYSYAITGHKAQGSQWAKVVVYDESAAFREDAWRWLYTAITRGQVDLTVVR